MQIHPSVRAEVSMWTFMSIGYGDIYLGHKSVFGKLYRVTDPHVFLVSFALIANAETILWQYSFASGTE